MRAFYRFFIFMIFLNSIIWGEGLTGEKIIGEAGINKYLTFAEAIKDLNDFGVGEGGVTFRVKGGVYSETSSLNIDIKTGKPKPTATNRVIFKPEENSYVTLNITQNTTYCLNILLSYVTFDGANALDAENHFIINSICNIDKNVGIYCQASYVAIKNCIINFPQNNHLPLCTGISVKAGASNCEILNNRIYSFKGIKVGLNVVTLCDNHKISNNFIQFSAKGIEVLSTFNQILISNNVLKGNLTDSTSTDFINGIEVQSLRTSGVLSQINIKGNCISDLGSQGIYSSVFDTQGIKISGYGVFNISENIIKGLNNKSNRSINGILSYYQTNSSENNIYNIKNNIFSNFQNITSMNRATQICALNTGAVGSYYFYNNSIYFDSYCFSSDISPLICTNFSSLVVKNNIFQCSNITNDSPIYFYIFSSSASTNFSFDYNNYFYENVQIFKFSKYFDISYSTLATWKTFLGSPNETHSQVLDPLFHSPTDLHLLPSSPCAGSGVTLAGIETDIDGNTRKNPPDIGADEFTPIIPAASGNTSNPPAGATTNIIPQSSAGSVQIAPTTTSTGNVSAYFYSQAPSGNLPNEITSISNYHWVLSTNMHNFETDVVFYFDNITNNGITNTDNIELLKRENQSEDWKVYTNVTKEENRIIAHGLTSFSEFAIGQNNSTPVEATNFCSSVNGNTVILNWETATEINSYCFVVEKKPGNNTTWISVDTLLTKGNSNTTNNYEFSESNVFSGRYIYRIKHINMNGSYEYIKTFNITVGTPNTFILHQNYPNPFNPSTTINFDIPISTNVKIVVYTITGEKLFTLLNEKLEAGNYSYTFNFGSLASGVYFYKLETSEFVSVKKMVLLR